MILRAVHQSRREQRRRARRPSSRSLATRPTRCGASRAASCCAARGGRGRALRLHALREERADDARQDVAGARGRERRQAVGARRGRRRPVRRPACRRPSGARRSRTLGRRGDRREPVRRDPVGRRRRAGAPARPRAASARVGAAPLDRLELAQRVGVDDDRQLEPREQAAHERRASRRCGRGPARARPRRALRRSSSSAARRRRRPSSSGSGRLTASSSRVSSTGSANRRRGDGDVARVGAERASAARHGAPVSPREPPTTSTEPARVLVVVAAACAGPSTRIDGCTSRARVAVEREPDRRDERRRRRGSGPGATASPTFGACIVTVTSPARRRPATSPVDASTPDGHVDRDDGAPRGVDRARSFAPPRRAARP